MAYYTKLYMRLISSKLTDDNFQKVKDYQVKLSKENLGRINFTDALNYLVENFK